MLSQLLHGAWCCLCAISSAAECFAAISTPLKSAWCFQRLCCLVPSCVVLVTSCCWLFLVYSSLLDVLLLDVCCLMFLDLILSQLLHGAACSLFVALFLDLWLLDDISTTAGCWMFSVCLSFLLLLDVCCHFLSILDWNQLYVSWLDAGSSDVSSAPLCCVFLVYSSVFRPSASGCIFYCCWLFAAWLGVFYFCLSCFVVLPVPCFCSINNNFIISICFSSLLFLFH